VSGGYVTIAHGGGGTRMQDLLRDLIFPALGEGSLDAAEDAARFDVPDGQLAFTTDSFVVKPLFFSGGDIGKLAVCGTVNDLAMVGARPLYLTLGLILEEGLALDDLARALGSLAASAKSAGVRVVAGDTKVVEKGKADGMYINTSGVGVVPAGVEISISGARPGDALLINGYVGDHGIAVLKDRGDFTFDVALDSDCAPLNGLVEAMLGAGEVHSLRDPTRGGLAAALKEMSTASGVAFEIDEGSIPVREQVRAICEVLGLDPLYVANEGKLLAAVAPQDAPGVLAVIRTHPLGKDASIIGSLGSSRLLRMPSGEQLPRIC
jgi:hydrogenase expression/formation protein HypE